MTELDFESDAFLTLLTDALRAGPGSPPWHEALNRLRAGGVKYADEYRLLVTAREHLESSKSYRSVRAGPGFTSRLMRCIEEEAEHGVGTAGPPASTTTLIAVLSAAAVLVVLLAIGYLLWTGADKPSAAPDANVLLVNTVTDCSFDKTLPSDWHTIGSLPVEFTRSTMKYRPSNQSSATAPTGPTGGGVTWTTPIAPDEPFAVVASIKVNKPEENLIAQVFVTDQPDFSDDNATTPHELVWLLHAGESEVILPNGRLEAQAEQFKDFKGSIQVRVTIDHDQANVDQNNKRQWSGDNGLDPAKPRYVGVRFLKRSDDAGDGVVFQSARVNMRQK
ncbi:MAG TPA: hypothetical protein VH518_09525 [Tepidisphaeraceae bacterium]|jgi:hypothetical protein